MENLTTHETAALDAIFSACDQDYSGDLQLVATACGITQQQAKGVISSLVKKKRVTVETENRGGQVFHDVFYLMDGKVYSFGEVCR